MAESLASTGTVKAKKKGKAKPTKLFLKKKLYKVL